jgi:hypothetical protein
VPTEGLDNRKIDIITDESGYKGMTQGMSIDPQLLHDMLNGPFADPFAPV